MLHFRHRLALSFCGLLALATAFTEVMVTRRLRERRLQELKAELTMRARVVALRAEPREVRELAGTLGGRVTLIAPDGQVRADSHADARRLENHRDRPEVRAALAGGVGTSVRRSESVHQDLIYAAVPLPGGGAARVALPLTEVRRSIAEVRRLTLAVSLTFMLMGAAASLWLARSLSRPLDDISAVAARLSAGDYSARVRELPPDEHGRLGHVLNALASRVQTAVAELSRDKAQLEAILGSVVEAVAAVDKDGKLIAVNPAFTLLFGSVEALRHPALNQLASAVRADGKQRVEEIVVFSPDERVFEAHAVPLAGGALLILHDITRLRRLEKLRREFVANVSHELRTPLTSIRGFAETLRSGVEDEAQRAEFLEAIEKDAQRLAALVDDLLDLSAIESGQAKLRREPVDLAALAREAAASLRPVAEKRRVAIEVSGAGAAKGDRDRLMQVVRNLIDNGVKFNREGGSVLVKVRDGELAVSDSGAGIPAEDLPRVFERFYRVDKARTRDVGGTGLGLSIVKHIVEAHGGAVQAESKPGEGATFTVSLPVI